MKALVLALSGLLLAGACSQIPGFAAASPSGPASPPVQLDDGVPTSGSEVTAKLSGDELTTNPFESVTVTTIGFAVWVADGVHAIVAVVPEPLLPHAAARTVVTASAATVVQRSR